mgnify:CR=1 FL=1
MKKLLVLIFILSGISAMSQKSYTVNCEAVGISGDAILNQYRGGDLVEIGKSQIVDGKFSFTGSANTGRVIAENSHIN